MKPSVPILICALSSSAFAQSSDQVLSTTDNGAITIQQLRGGGFDRNPYATRADFEVYNVGTIAETGGDWRSSGTNVYDDVTFAGPYFNNSTPLVLNGMAFGVTFSQQWDPSDHLYTRVSFYPNHDAAAPSSLTPYSGTPVVAYLDWGAGWSQSEAPPYTLRYVAYPARFASPFATLSTANVFSGGPTDRSAGVKIELFLDAAGTTRATTWQLLRRGQHNHKVGSSDPYSWFSTAQVVNSGDIFNVDGTQRSGNSTSNRSTYMSFLATSMPLTTPAAIDLGVLTDNGVHLSNIAVGQSPVWYKFQLPQAAADYRDRFLDIDAEGSTADLSLALFRGSSNYPSSEGTLIATDDDSGSGVNPMLSFGMGRRLAAGDGRAYDGRNFDPSPFSSSALQIGTYYLCLAPAGSTFADGFNVAPGSVNGIGELHIRTNVNGTPLAPPLPPIPAPADELGRLVQPGAQAPPSLLQPFNPRWITFTTCADATDAAPVTISFTGTSTTTVACILFSSAGNVVKLSQGLGTSLSPIYPMTFDTTDPLPAGTYYLAATYAPIDITNYPNNGRWHFRSTSNAPAFNFGVNIAVSSSCPTCGSSDFNGDGDSGADADIEAFFACLAGDCCATCFAGGSDFNADGDSGTDADIESFFRVLAGGPC